MRVWVGNLGKYNEGILVGEWITLPMPKNQLDDILRNKVGLQLTQQEVDEVNINNDKDEPDICD